MILAMVVLPTPGGPHKIIDGTTPWSIALRNILPFPVRCSCPVRSLREAGLSRSASGGGIRFYYLAKLYKLPSPKYESLLLHGHISLGRFVAEVFEYNRQFYHRSFFKL